MTRSLGDLQRPDANRGDAAGRLPLNVTRTRTFDTPEFAGMTFLEVDVKSALNRVHGMPFAWSINPYRGCSHACSYCAVGETPILMADGRTKSLADVRVGDEIYGTVRRGAYRRYVTTRVLDHWSTRKPAYRVTLADGTELITSGDHRFLTDRGWKHVTGAEQGRERRPFLTNNNKLRGTGAFAEPPKGSPDYRCGYLCGIVRGDAHLASYSYERQGRTRGDVHRFRLALVDEEPLERTGGYLLDEGVPTQPFSFSAATATRKAVRAIRTQTAAGVASIRELIRWPVAPSAEWHKGFLAGLFDAEGCYSQGVFRISNTDEAIITRATASLRSLGFSFTVERSASRCPTVRLLGGIPQALRFFHLTDPAIARKRSIEGMALKSNVPLRVAAVEPLGVELPMYDITTGTGDFISNGVVSHNCFARPSHAYLNLSPVGDFERTIVVKTNLVEVLRRELAKPSWQGDSVAMGTNTDPYQRCEGRYRLMPGVIGALADYATPFSILTKGTLITRDIDPLVAAAERVEVTAAFTVGMLDESVWRAAEPGTPSPRARLEAVAALNAAGIPTGVMLAPIMPGLNDDREQLAALVDACAVAGATHITPIVLHLRRGQAPAAPKWLSVREAFWPWLEANHPELVDRYEQLYARGAYAAKDYRDEVTAFVAEQRKRAWRRHGRPPPRRPRGQGAKARPQAGNPDADHGAQLSLL